MLQAIRKLFASGPVEERRPDPVCFLVGDVARFASIAQAIEPLGLSGEPFVSVTEMLAETAARPPDLVFLDLSLSIAAATQAILSLSTLKKHPALQLVSPVDVTSYEQVCAVGQLRLLGEQKGLRMPQAMQPPYSADAVKKIFSDLGLRRDIAGEPKVTLAQALKHEWLELWYQPKIELATNRLIGAEGLLRIRHPEQGTLFPLTFLPGASEDEVLRMTERVIITALRDWEELAANGIPGIKLAVNTPVSALIKLPLAALLRAERPRAENWPGLILEVTEDNVIVDLDLAVAVANELRAHNCSLAIDDFGAGYSSLARLRALPFSELKIDRAYVSNCHADRINAGLCETIVELAHRFNLKAVAEGVETIHESHKLQGMGCDAGQGYLFAKPMERVKFISLLRRRMVTQPAPAAPKSWHGGMLGAFGASSG
jgi:EAL domain-containing protein (putative c-di-GMP-specific phosphodiesterase class I)